MGAAESKLPTPEPEPVLNFEELDFYAILGVSRSFSDDDLKQAYRGRAKATHPDKDHKDGATERFRKVLEAYETLKSPATRATYDEKLRQEKTKRDSETKPQGHQNTHMPGQYGHKPDAQATGPSPPGWFSWLFDSLGFGDPLLRYVPETYIAQNRGRDRPQGMSARDIYDYFELCLNDKMATWDESVPQKSMYTLIQNLFECIAYDEKMWGRKDDVPHYGFGHSAWCFEDVPDRQNYVADFYHYWLKFETKKTFDWVNPYRTDVNDRTLGRQVNIENAKVQAQCRDQYNKTVSGLVAALLHGDPRCFRHLLIRASRDGDLVSMDIFCERYIKRHGHRSQAETQQDRSQGNNPAPAGKPTQKKSQKKRHRRKRKKGN